MRVQRILSTDGEQTWTVLGRDLLPIAEVESYLETLRQTKASPNTVKAYARALALWFEYLEARRVAWDRFSLEIVTGFIGWMRSGLPPDVVALAPPKPKVADSTLAQRLQAVRSFYMFHEWAGVRGLPPMFTSRQVSSRYVPFLAHLRTPRHEASMRIKVPRRRTVAPILTPAQITAVKDACATRDVASGSWTGSARDRLLFSVLEETGLRLGELLSLQHRDWHSGSGESPFIEVVPRPHPLGMRVKSGLYRKLYISDSLDRLYADYVWQLCEEGLDLAVEDIDSHWVFVNMRGGDLFAPMRPETVYKLIERIKKRLGSQVPPGFSPHWFRHTHASTLLLSGAQPHTVSRRLGHAQVQTTLDIYAWVIEDEELRKLVNVSAAADEPGGLS